MKNIQKLFIAGTIVLTIVIAGCSKNSENNPLNPGNGGPNNSTGKVVLNGSGWSNSEVNFSLAVGYYIPQENLTYVEMFHAQNGDTLVVAIAFPGNQTGTYEWAEESYGAYLVDMRGNATSSVYYPKPGGQTVITEFGNVNHRIKGTYSGILVSALSTDSVTVSGNFDVVRMPDENSVRNN